MYEISYTSRFLASAKRFKKEGKNMSLLWDAVAMLEQDGKLPESYLPHLLHKEFAGYWECHIEDDWLLIWKQNDKKLTLVLTHLGTHDSLFKK